MLNQTRWHHQHAWPPEPGSVRQARKFVSGLLRAHGLGRVEVETLMVVSELATNAVVHARTTFSVSVAYANCGLTVTVHNRTRDASPRGQRTARRWGVVASSSSASARATGESGSTRIDAARRCGLTSRSPPGRTSRTGPVRATLCPWTRSAATTSGSPDSERPAPRVRPRVRLRPEHVALRRARVRGRLPGRALRPRRRRAVRPRRRTTPSATPPSTATPGRARDLPGARPARRDLRRPLGGGMIGVLAANREPERFAGS